MTVNSAWARFVARYRTLPQSTTPILVIFGCVLLGNILFLIGMANVDPISWTTQIARILCNVTCGRPAIDPNVGYITQSLGHLSAMDILHGHLPWWNFYEGIGQPLAGEMQSAALFPLTLLFALPSGLLWFHMSLELIAGVSTYLLARRLSVPLYIATAAGVLFALNGTFSWMGNAVLNPVAFMPMLILGIEIIFDNAKSGSTKKGWYVAAIALALSMYAGFPEVAYFDGLFCAGWAIVRFFSLDRSVRLVAARRVGLAGGVGLILSLPILVPFYDFIKVANIGTHAAGGYSSEHLNLHGAAMFVDPYVYGTIFANVNAGNVWGGIGGYFTISVVALALLGLFGSRLRSLRIFLGAWAIIGTLSIFNIADLRLAWNILPLAESAVLPRYIMPSCELALIILAILGIMDFAKERRAKRLLTTVTVASLLLLIVAALSAHGWNVGVIHTHKTRLVYDVLDAVPFVAVFTLLVLGRFSSRKITALLVAILVCGETIVMFEVPTGGAAKQIHVDMTPIQYLQTHVGENRFLDMGILSPNWGTEFNINSLSAVDLPFPKTFAHLILTQLYPGLTPVNQFVIHGGLTGIIEQEQEIVDHYAAYQKASLQYLITPTPVILLPSLVKLGVKRVFEDSIVAIYELPAPRNFFSANSCTVTSTNDDSASLNCPSGGSTLIRSELFMAGWHASVNGKAVKIKEVNDAYQSVAVPGGTSTVTYSFVPPHEDLALVAGFFAGLFLVYSWIRERVPSRRLTRQPRHKR